MKNSILFLMSFVTGYAEAKDYLGQLSSNPYCAGSMYKSDNPNNPYGSGWSIYSD